MHAVDHDLPWPRASGLLLGRYEPLGVIGRGGMGVVSRARDARTGRLVAIKRVRGMDDRAQREALASARLHHSAIVELIEARATGDGWILVSELVEGADLRHVLRAGRVPELDVARFAGSVLRGLAHAHEHGVVHRDVKPANILCPRDPRAAGAWAKLTDFGVAALHDAETLTAAGDVVGTMTYMAPEQARGNRAGPPADVFALAVVVFEALAGYNPRRGDTPAESAVRALSGLPSLERSRPDLPRGVLDGVDACLAVDPRDRGDLWDLDEGLRRLAAVGHGHARRVARGPAERERAAPPLPPEDVPERTRHRSAPPVPAGPLPPQGRHPGDFALSPRALGPHAAPEPVVDAWPDPHDPADELPPLAVPGRMPKVPLRILGTAGAAAAVGVVSEATTTPPAVLAVAAAAFVMPRITWTAIAATAAVLLSGVDQTAAALAVLTILAPALLLARRPPLWPAAGLAAGLAAIGGAGAWPALAALAPRALTRLGLAIQGGLVAAVTAVATRTPALDAPPGDLVTVATTFAFPLAGIWAVAALLLGVIIRGRTLGFDLVAAAFWAGAVGGAMAGAHLADPQPVLWVGPAVAALIVVAARAALREQDRARITPTS